MINSIPRSLCVAASTAAATIILSAQSHAQNTDDERLEETFVSASLTPLSPFDALASVDSIGRETISALQISDLGEAISLLAGTDISRTGGLGAPTSLFTRGTNSNHTLMLINGQRFSSATLGTTSFQLIDPNLVERVEFVRGSRSALYGADALGGVMQIFTYGQAEDPEHYFNLEYGSHETLRSSLGSRGELGRTAYAVGVSIVDSNGFDDYESTDGASGDDDAYSSLAGNLFVAHTFNNDIELSFSHVANQSESDYDNVWVPTSDPYRENVISATQVGLNVPFTDNFDSQLNIGLSADESDELDRQPDAFESHFDTNRESVYWQNNWQFHASSLLTFGLDYYEEEVEASTVYSETQRDNNALFAQIQSNFGAFDVQAGLRNDDNSAYGKHSTGSLALGFAITEHHRLYASWAEGFRAPTFNDLYWPNAGSPNLKPETSENYELGYKAQLEFFQWSVSAYKTDVLNLIDWAPGADDVWRPTNIADAEIEGVELKAAATFGNWLLQGSASHTNPKDKASGQTLNNRAKNKLSLDARQSFENWHYGFIVLAQSDREVSFGDNINSYELLDVYAAYQINEAIQIGAKVANVFNTDYALSPGYNTDERNFKLNVKFTF